MAVDGAPACAPLCFTYEGCWRGQTQTGVSIKKKKKEIMLASVHKLTEWREGWPTVYLAGVCVGQKSTNLAGFENTLGHYTDSSR